MYLWSYKNNRRIGERLIMSPEEKKKEFGYEDIIEIGYDEWYVFKINELSYEYKHFPMTCCGLDQEYKITISLENKMYKFDAKEYAELYGSGGWSRWTFWKDELKDILLKDVKERIKNE